MNKFQNITNPEFLKELAQRLANFIPDDFMILTSLLSKYQPEFMKVIQSINPQVYHWVQEKIQTFEQEKTDQEAKELKKSLEK